MNNKIKETKSTEKKQTEVKEIKKDIKKTEVEKKEQPVVTEKIEEKTTPKKQTDSVKKNIDKDSNKDTDDNKDIEKIESEKTKTIFVNQDLYLSSGIYIGMSRKLKIMAPFIYKIRSDGLCIFDLKKIEERIGLLIKWLSQYKPNEILAVSRKKNGHKAVSMLGKATEIKTVYGRFMPGMLSNPGYKEYFEPKILIACDPYGDKQAIEEAYKIKIPVVCLCDTYNFPRLVDFVIPLNNKGRKSIALFFYILAKELLKENKTINGDAEFKYTPEDFEMDIEDKL